MQVLAARAEQLHTELLKEPVHEIPAELAVPDFERWVLKVAVHFLQSLEEEGGKDALPLYLQRPEIAALRIKELVVEKLPDGYIATERNPSLLGPDYLYTFPQPIPRQVFIQAAVDAGVL